MHNNFRGELEEDELEQAQGESKAGPIVSVLQDLQDVAVEINLAVKVLLHESFHRNLAVSTVFLLVFGIFEGKVVIDRATRELRLLGLARTI